MSLFRQILVLIALTAVAYGGYAAYDHWRTGLAAISPDAGKQSGGAMPAAQSGGRGARATNVEITAAEQRSMSRQVEAIGTALALRTVDIKPQSDGRIIKIGFAPGARVSEGEVLFLLDDDIQRADFAQAVADLDLANLALQRAKTLKKSSIATQASVEELEAALATAKASVARAERRLADRIIKAPFAGTTRLKQYDVGAQVETTDVLTTLDDLSQIQVEFAIPEQFYAAARTGLEVVATSAAWPGREFTAILNEIDTRVDPVSRVFRARASIDNQDNALVQGMFMQVVLTLETEALVMVPEEAVVVDGSKTFVYVVADDKATRRDVQTGAREPGFVAISSGLSPGDNVVSSGVSKIRNGASVKIVTSEDEPRQ